VKPVLFQVPTPFGTFPVSSFGIFLLLAFIAGILLTRARTRRLGWDGGEVLDLALYAIIGGIIGARIGYVLVNFKDFAAVPARAVMIWVDAGLTLYGGLAGGAVVAWAYGRRRGWTLGQIADAAAPGLALGYAVAMVGALLYGLNYGRPAHVPWAVMLFGEPRHPTQLYLAAAALAVCAVLLAVDRGVWGSGRLFWLFVLLMAVARVAIEPFMDSARSHGVTLAQGVNALAAVIAAVMWLTRRTEAGAKEPPIPSPAAAPSPPEPPLAPTDVGGSHG
jgi:phosphatidylglycerol:prolipoprotein diacylglycerol transferase